MTNEQYDVTHNSQLKKSRYAGIDAPYVGRPMGELLELHIAWHDCLQPTFFAGAATDDLFKARDDRFWALRQLIWPDEGDFSARLETDEGRAWLATEDGRDFTSWRRERDETRPGMTPAEADALSAYLAERTPDDNGRVQTADDLGSRTQILQDRLEIFPGGDPEAYIRDYTKSLPFGWRESIIVFLSSGFKVVVVRWTARREHIRDTRAWAETQYSGDRQRWRVLETFSPDGYERVPIPPSAPPARTLSDIIAKAAPTANAILPTGITALDRALAIGGVPLRGARVVVQAPTANAKTTFALEIAASYAAAGISVGWIATGDEPPESIHARWLQREGMSREAAAAAATGDGELAPSLYLIDGRAIVLEDVLTIGGFDILFLDPLQKVRTRAGADSGKLEQIGKVLELVEKSGLTCWMTSAQVRASGGRQKRSPLEASYGGGGIENGATLLLGLALAGAALTVSILKSRYGGEGETLALTADRERQRVLSPGEAQPAAGVGTVEARIWADVQAALGEGPRSKRWLEDHITGGAASVRKVIAARLKAGDLVTVNKLITLPG